MSQAHSLVKNTEMGRNFRVQFLERVCSSDPSASIRLSSETGRLFLEEQLKQKGDLDVSKLAKYSIRYTIPSRHRAEVWKLLLRIASPWPEARPVIAENRQQEAARLWTTLRKMLSLHYERQLPLSPNPRLIALMVLLSSTDSTIFDLQTTRFISPEHHALLLISERMSLIVQMASTIMKQQWEDIYWLSAKLHERLCASVDSSVWASLVEETMVGLKGIQERLQAASEDQAVDDSLNSTTNFDQSSEKQVHTCFDSITNRHIETWFRSAGALWLQDEPLFMLWDKLCAHDAVIPLLKSCLYQLFGTIAMISPERYKKTDPNQLLNKTLPLSIQLQVIKLATDDVLNRSLISTDIPISLTY